MYCRTCGNQMHRDAEICVKCGVRKYVGSDYCQVCGWDGEIEIVEEDGKLIWKCPKCGNSKITFKISAFVNVLNVVRVFINAHSVLLQWNRRINK